MPEPEDLIARALKTSREAFIREFDCFFVLTADALAGGRPRASTDVYQVIDAVTPPPFNVGDDRATGDLSSQLPPRPLLIPVRKTTSADPDRISVGRSSSNDVAIPDKDISRAHACFRVYPDRITLADLGSQNGTMVDGRLLEPKGPTEIVIPGARLRFAHIEFEFLDAAAVWDRLHHLG